MSEYNIYCDESCHLEHDGEKYMVIGGIICPKSYRKRIISNIMDIKRHYNIPSSAEIKWNKVSPCNLDYFKSIAEYFFSESEMKFRAVVVDKTKLRHEDFNQTHDDFYYKMYFHCLSGLITPAGSNFIYLDKKDSHGSRRIQCLSDCLSRKTHDFDRTKIKRIQCVDSKELPILQLTDLLIGAIGYNSRNIEYPSQAKIDFIDYIKELSGYSLEKSTFLSETKFNLFFIGLQ